MAPDPVHGSLYWTDSSRGEQWAVIVSVTVRITPLGSHHSGLVWWSNTHFHRLGSARLDGSGRADLLELHLRAYAHLHLRVAADLLGLHLPRVWLCSSSGRTSSAIGARCNARRSHTRVVETGTQARCGRAPPLSANASTTTLWSCTRSALQELHRLRQLLLIG